MDIIKKAITPAKQTLQKDNITDETNETPTMK